MAAFAQSSPEPVTQPRRAVDAAFHATYGELRSLARLLLMAERTGHTLQTTALVHEAYLRLVAQRSVAWEEPARVRALAAMAMRRALVDHARGRHRLKRESVRDVGVDAEALASMERGQSLIELDDALRQLAIIRPDAASAIELRFFGGLTVEEISVALGRSESTVRREWRYARAWLRRQLERAPGDHAELRE